MSGPGYGPNSGTYVSLAERNFDLPTGAGSQTIPRSMATGDQNVLSTGRLNLHAIPLRAGQLVSTITFVSGTTAVGTGSNQWFALYSAARALLGVTNDDTSAAWAANSAKTLTLASPYSAPSTGLYYLGICVVATQVPSLRGAGTTSQILGIAPILGGTSTTGLTNPASAPSTAAAITAQGATPYAYVS